MSTWLLLALAAAASPPAQPSHYAIDVSRSHVRVHLRRAGLLKLLGHDHLIEAPVAEGRVSVVAGDPPRSSVRLHFDAAKLAVVPGSEPQGDVPSVEERMRGPEVLDAAQHPRIAFASTSVRVIGSEGSRYRLVVTGTLELRGRSLALEVPLDVSREGDTLEARGEVGLKLRELGIEPPSVAGLVKVADRFRLELELVAVADPNLDP